MHQLDEFTPGFAHVVVHLGANFFHAIAQFVEPHGACDLDGKNFVLVVGGAGVFGDVAAYDFAPLGFQLPALESGCER